MMEHRIVSIADQVFEKLEHDILSGEYARGEVLTETRLSEKLGVSRTPIREALRRLEQEHIIEMRSKGAVVIGISREDIDAIYEIRQRIEGMAARYAAQNVTDSALHELKEIVDLQEFYVEKGDADNIKNMDSAFHEKIYQLCGSTPLCDTLSSLHRKILKYRRASVANTSRAHHSLEEHRAIYDAIAAHDADRAEQLTIAHIHNARVHIVGAP